MKTILITGGAGFIGSNTVNYFAQKNWKVIILDNLSRKGSKDNLHWLESQGHDSIEFLNLDIRDTNSIHAVFKKNRIDALIHLAAQAAVTKSVDDPKQDFDINAIGTLNILESLRQYSPETIMINASTNKVYGQLEDTEIIEEKDRYKFASLSEGISENMPLDFHSPYGCSKGAADQYTIDYSRIYGLITTTFRQSCIYGPRQFGSEDQGWISWFIVATLSNKQLKIYGDGKQVRDVLYIDDLIHAYDLAINNPNNINGEAFNVGGGVNNTSSLKELLDMLTIILDKEIPYTLEEERPGDQKVYISNIEKISKQLGWNPKISPQEGVNRLIEWTRKQIK